METSSFAVLSNKTTNIITWLNKTSSGEHITSCDVISGINKECLKALSQQSQSRKQPRSHLFWATLYGYSRWQRTVLLASCFLASRWLKTAVQRLTENTRPRTKRRSNHTGRFRNSRWRWNDGVCGQSPQRGPGTESLVRQLGASPPPTKHERSEYTEVSI